MSYKLIGIVCVIVACGGAGFMMAGQYISQIRMLADMIIVLDYMESEIQYRCTPLTPLCRQAAEQVGGKIHQIFLMLADELEAQISPSVEICMTNTINKLGLHQCVIREILTSLSCNLGKFDILGQVRALENTRNLCSEKLKQLQMQSQSRVRSYQTLGLCAGAAIAILFV